MLQRWKMSHNNSMVTEPDGEWVEYKDHLAVVAEKDRVIIKLLDKIDEVSDLKDREIAVLRALLPDNVEVIMKEDNDD